MRHLVSRIGLIMVVAFVASILLAPSAPAKGGPSQAVITGPDLAAAIMLREPGSSTIGPDLAAVVMESGFFVGMSGDTRTHGCLGRRPAGDLGPRYTITYTMSLGSSGSGEIVQYVYPYAEPRPITHMPPHQNYWRSYETEGSWYAAHVDLRQTLIGVGLPATTPSGAEMSATATDAGSRTSIRPWAIPVWIAAALVAIALATVLNSRRRSHPARI